MLAEYADNIVRVRDALGETAYLRRLARGPYVAAAFEHVAMRSKHDLASGGMERLYGGLQKDRAMASRGR